MNFRISKKAAAFSFIAAVCVAGCFSASPVIANESDENESGFTAVVTSDLHFTKSDSTAATVVPSVSVAEEIIRTFTTEVIDLKPDAWIITGDMTNSGKADDVEALGEILKLADDAGIEVVTITGNHDFDKGDIGSFEKSFLSLPDKTSSDTASLSYAVVCGNVRLLAMDDAGGTDDSYGAKAEFSDTTMEWLKGQLEEAKEAGETCIFLAHRSVLFKTSYDAGVDYSIRNEDLEDLLRAYDVQLCLTGHQHSQSLLESDGMYEIISCMPLTGEHRFGWLTVDENGVNYEDQKIDFEKYATPEDLAAVAQADELSAQQSAMVVESILGNSASEEDATGDADGASDGASDSASDSENKDAMRELLSKFFVYHEDGTIGAHAAEILADPAWEDLKAAIDETNYGPWIEGILANPPRDAFHLSF